MKRALAVANGSALANMAMTMYQDTIISLSDYGHSINLSIKIERETMDLVKVYATFETWIVDGARISHYYNEKTESDYIEIHWNID